MEKKQEQPLLYDPAQCPCSNAKCERNRNCEACQSFHHARGGLTRCERRAKKEN